MLYHFFCPGCLARFALDGFWSFRCQDCGTIISEPLRPFAHRRPRATRKSPRRAEAQRARR